MKNSGDGDKKRADDLAAEASPEIPVVEDAASENLDEAGTDVPAAEMPDEPFDESQLLELAKNEGLLDEVPMETEVEGAEPVELSEADQAQILSSMETILFMSDKPVSLPRLRSIINTQAPLAAYRQLMARLREEFGRDHRGVEVAEVSLGFQLRTKPHMAQVLRKMVRTQPLKISPTSMEVLAIVAYKQPVTKDELDQIRGVDGGYVLRTLMEKRLVRITGRSDLPGRPMLYGTTHEFLELFSLKDVKALPPLHEVESMVAASEVGVQDQAQAAIQEFSKMVANSDKILFDDSQIDEELEALRSEIASVPTSTAFIDEQKAAEKRSARVAELAAQGLMLDAEGNVVPIGSLTAAPQPAASNDAAEPQQHQPSATLEAEAAAAQWERHAAMIAQAIAETQVAASNAEAVSHSEVLTTETSQEPRPSDPELPSEA